MKQSIIQRQEQCFICGGTYNLQTHHCLHGTSNRKKADEDGLTVRLCVECHMNLHDHGIGDMLLKQIAQYCWEQTYGSRAAFRARYGKSYIP